MSFPWECGLYRGGHADFLTKPCWRIDGSMVKVGSQPILVSRSCGDLSEVYTVSG